MADFDLAIIGGGINGAGIARDAVATGLKVALLEQGELAAGTSSAFSKLIHGGLRLSGTWRLAAGARGAQRARSAAAHSAAFDPAASFRAATRFAPSLGGTAAAWPFHLRYDWTPRDFAAYA
jgi:glycine/D-amino acid oxidase-like deaminating enzyme